MGIRVVRAGSVALLMVSLSAPVCADQLYRWIDADGQVHFSDRAPAQATPSPVEQLPRPTYADPGISPEHYAITQQWQRLHEERLARERARRESDYQTRELALREREIEAAERAAEPSAVQPSWGVPVWTVPRRHLPHRRPDKWPYHRPNTGLWKPDHPAYRPPSRPHRRPVPPSRGIQVQF